MADSIFEGGGGGTPAGADTEIQYNNAGAFGASSDLIFDNTAKTFKVMSSANNLLLVDAATGDYGLGDLDGIGNSTRLFIDDTGSIATIAAGGDRIRLNIDGTAFTAKIGDVDSIGNDTVLTIDDANQILTYASGGATKMSLDVANDIYEIGNLAVSGTRAKLYIDGTNGIARLRSVNVGTGITANIETTVTSVQFQCFDTNRGSALTGSPNAATLSCSDNATSDVGTVQAGYTASFLLFQNGSSSSYWGVEATDGITKVGDFDLQGNSTLITVNDTAKTIKSAGGIINNYTAQTGTYAILRNDYIINCTSGTFTVTLPTAVGFTGQTYIIKNSGAGVITLATTSSQTIDGVTTQTIATMLSLTVVSTGANRIII